MTSVQDPPRPVLASRPRFSQPVRRGLLAAAVAVFIVAALGAAVSPEIEIGIVVAGLAACVVAAWTLADIFEVRPRDAPRPPASFEELAFRDREVGLDLAWSGDRRTGVEPAPPATTTDLAEWAVVLGAGFISWVYLWGCAQATGPLTYEHVEWAVFAQSLPLAPLWVLSGVLISRLRASKIEAAFSRYLVLWDAYAEANRLAALALLAVQWTTRNFETWVEQATGFADFRARERLALPGTGIECFFLQSPHDERFVPGMPPTHLELTVIALGPFLGIRSGFYLDVRRSSYAVGLERAKNQSGPPIATVERSPMETEFHFRDIVTVEYQRLPQGQAGHRGDVGVFQVGLVNGRSFAHQTLEHGVASCIEQIRRRTRAAKAAPS